MKKILLTILFGLLISGSFSAYTFAQDKQVQEVSPGQSAQSQLDAKNAEEEKNKSAFTMGEYIPLAQLPGFSKIDEGVAGGALGTFTFASYIKTLVRIAIGLIGILAVVMIVVSGVQYMGSSMFTEKEAAKSRLWGAVTGLILAISSVLILRTINPQLTNIELSIITDGNWCEENATTIATIKAKIDGNPNLKLSPEEQSIYDRSQSSCANAVASSIYIPQPLDLEGDAGTPVNYSGLTSLPPGAYCPKSGKSNSINQIATSFKGKNTYRYGGGHSSNEPPFPSEKSKWICEGGKQCKTFCPSGTSCLDCSAFVNQVLECAGYSRYDGATGAMVSDARSEKITNLTKTTANGKEMKPGDLLFWNGHVIIYIGNGKTAESFGGNEGRKPGNSIAIQDADHYKNKITHIYRVK